MKFSHWIVILEFLPLVAMAMDDFGMPKSHLRPIQLHSFNSHSRISVLSDASFPTELKNSIQGFEFLIKGLTFSDMGAPPGREMEWASQFSHLKDDRVDSLKLTEVPEGIKLSGKWVYPKGKLSLAHPSMETFEFHEKSPAQHVVDFWIKDKTTILALQELQEKKRLSDSFKVAEKGRQVRLARKLASENLQKEIENMGQFCNVPVNESNDFFLDFYPVHPKVDFNQWFPKGTADSGFHYNRPSQKTRDAAHVRIALDLRAQGKPGLAIRTLDFLAAETPHSQFDEEMKFLRANSLELLGNHQESNYLFKEIMTHHKGTPVALQSAMFLANKHVEENQTMAAFDKFQWLIQYYPNHPLSWAFHLGLAESLYALRQVDQAEKEYRWVIENGPNQLIKGDAALRSGDLYLLKRQNEQALAQYSQWKHHFKGEFATFPAFHLNRGEALFRIGKFPEAKEAFTEFLSKFPTHPHGWRATLRLGEISHRKANQKESLAEARKWFYETINRYPVSPGVTIARLRLLPCDDHGGFSKSSAENFFSKEAARYDGGGEVVLLNYEDLRGLSHVRTLMALGSIKDTVLSSIQEIKTARSPMLKKLLSTITDAYFQNLVSKLLSEGKKYQALQIYLEMEKLMPEPENHAQANYLIKLSLAASDLGLAKLAQRLTGRYLNIFNSKERHPERAVASQNISEKGEVNFEQKFSEAKALWLLSKDLKNPNQLNTVRDLLEKVPEESQFLLEKELILGLLAEREGRFDSALSHVSRAQSLSNSTRIQAWIAFLMVQAGNLNGALSIYHELEKRIVFEQDRVVPLKDDLEDLLGVPMLPPLTELVMREASILEKQNRWNDAASVYSKAISNGWGGSQMHFHYARALENVGGDSAAQKAESVLQELVRIEAKKGEDQFWKKLGEEAIANRNKEKLLTKNAMEGEK